MKKDIEKVNKLCYILENVKATIKILFEGSNVILSDIFIDKIEEELKEVVKELKTCFLYEGGHKNGI